MNSDAFDWVSSHADRTPDKTALVNTATGTERTYEEFDRRASRFAEVLTEQLEIDVGSRVAILSRNSTEYFEVLYGCAKADATYVALNWRLAPPELEYIIDDADPSILLYDPEFADTVETLRGDIGVDQFIALPDPVEGDQPEPSTDDGLSYETVLSQTAGTRREMPDHDRTDTWGLLYTSGTTGRPKGVKQTFDMVLYNYLNIGLPIDLTSEDTTLNVLPFFHTGGLNLYTNPTLIAGGTALVQPEFDPGAALDILEERATVFFGVPAIYRALFDHASFEQRDLGAVRSWASGGAPMPVSLIETYAERDITIQQGFGMTETGPTVFLIDEANAVEKAGSVGQPSPFVNIDIVDADGNSVETGETGELLVRGPGVTPGYWENPEAQEDAFSGQWLHTGDVAKQDEGGYVYIVDRLKNMFISGGENVYPAEIEAILHDHKAIAEAAVVGIPDEEWGQVGKAFVVVEDEPSLTTEAVKAYCDEQLASYKVPKTVELVEELPRNAAGKVERETLKSRAE